MRCFELCVAFSTALGGLALGTSLPSALSAASGTSFGLGIGRLQLHGGYGYMWEYPITRAWADARVQRIYAGTSEIMKEIISRTL